LRLNSLPRFLRFGIVGCAGYGVDVAALYVAIYGFGAGFYWGRLFSYLCAASSTWYMNRLFTFGDLRSDKFAGEWLKFVLLNGV
jgi:putative flippase GtrA